MFRDDTVDEELDMRADRGLLVDDPEAQPGVAGVERGQDVGQRRSRCHLDGFDAARVRTQQAGDAYDHRSRSGFRTLDVDAASDSVIP